MEVVNLQKNRRAYLEEIASLLKGLPEAMSDVRSGSEIEKQVSVESQPLPGFCHKSRTWLS